MILTSMIYLWHVAGGELIGTCAMKGTIIFFFEGGALNWSIGWYPVISIDFPLSINVYYVTCNNID